MMEENIKECGKMESSMEKENFFIRRKIAGKEEYGMMVKESDGLLRIMLQRQIEIKFLNQEFLYLIL